MRSLLFASLLLVSLCADAAETWLLKVERWGTVSSMTMQLEQKGQALSGTLDGDRLEGRRDGDQLDFTVVDRKGKRYLYSGRVNAGAMRGRADYPDTNRADARAMHTFSALRLPERRATAPQTHIMTLGQAGSLDEALRVATAGMTQWLQHDYGLTLSEAAVVLGSAVEYSVANLAGRSVGVAAKLKK